MTRSARSDRSTKGTGRDAITRVAVVTPYYPPRLGGVERYAERVAAQVRDTPGHAAVVITTRSGWRTRAEPEGEVPIVRLGRWMVISNSPVSPLWAWQVRRWLRRLDVDVVNAHAPVPGLADITVLLGGRPVILTYHAGTLVKGVGGAVDAVLRSYERHVLPRVLRRCAALISVSPASFTHNFGGELIPGGVDLERFTPGQRTQEPRLLFVGRIERASRWKGLHVLLDAMPTILATIPGAVLEVVGNGDAVPELQQQCERLGLVDNVTWRGALHGDELIDAYRRAWLLALPSLTDAENSPLVVMEAMACGVPVVASRAGGVPYMIDDRVDGRLVDPGDNDALAAACIDILDAPDAAAELGRAARARAERDWSWERQAGQVVSVCDRVAAART